MQTRYIYNTCDEVIGVYIDKDEDGVMDQYEPQVNYVIENTELTGIETYTTDYTLTYDVYGNVLTVKAGDYTLAQYEYAANNGKLLSLTYGNGDKETYEYDTLDRLTEE